jgi:hypothetical protein
LLVVIAVMAIMIVLYMQFSEWRFVYEESAIFTHARQIFSLNILLLTTCTVVAFLGRRSQRRFATGYAAFGWVYLITLLRGSYFFGEQSSSMDSWQGFSDRNSDKHHCWNRRALLATAGKTGPEPSSLNTLSEVNKINFHC